MNLPTPDPQAPVVLAFERPLNQCYLTIGGPTLLEWAETLIPAYVSLDGRVLALTVREVPHETVEQSAPVPMSASLVRGR